MERGLKNMRRAALILSAFTALSAAAVRRTPTAEEHARITDPPVLLFPRADFPSSYCGLIEGDRSSPVVCPEARTCVFTGSHAGCCPSGGCGQSEPIKTSCIPRSKCPDGDCGDDDDVLRCVDAARPFCIAQVYTAKSYTSWICDNEDYHEDVISQITHSAASTPAKTPAETTSSAKPSKTAAGLEEEEEEEGEEEESSSTTEKSKGPAKTDDVYTTSTMNGEKIVYKNGQTVAPFIPKASSESVTPEANASGEGSGAVRIGGGLALGLCGALGTALILGLF